MGFWSYFIVIILTIDPAGFLLNEGKLCSLKYIGVSLVVHICLSVITGRLC